MIMNLSQAVNTELATLINSGRFDTATIRTVKRILKRHRLKTKNLDYLSLADRSGTYGGYLNAMLYFDMTWNPEPDGNLRLTARIL